jgi:hypothetical protein
MYQGFAVLETSPTIYSAEVILVASCIPVANTRTCGNRPLELVLLILRLRVGSLKLFELLCNHLLGVNFIDDIE